MTATEASPLVASADASSKHGARAPSFNHEAAYAASCASLCRPCARFYGGSSRPSDKQSARDARLPGAGTGVYSVGKVLAMLFIYLIGGKLPLVASATAGVASTLLFTIGTAAAFFLSWLPFRLVSSCVPLLHPLFYIFFLPTHHSSFTTTYRWVWPSTMLILVAWVDASHHGLATSGVGVIEAIIDSLINGIFERAAQWNPFYSPPRSMPYVALRSSSYCRTAPHSRAIVWPIIAAAAAAAAVQQRRRSRRHNQRRGGFLASSHPHRLPPNSPHKRASRSSAAPLPPPATHSTP